MFMIMKFWEECTYWMLKILYLRQQHQCDREKNWIFIYRRIMHWITNLRVDKANTRRQKSRMLKIWEYLSFTAVCKSVISECEWSFYVLTKLQFMILVSVILSIVCSHREDFCHKKKWLVCVGFTKRVYIY